MQTEKIQLKLKCVGLVNKLNSKNVIPDAEKLHGFLSEGDIFIKVDCVNLAIDKENIPVSVESLIKNTEEIYNYVTKSED